MFCKVSSTRKFEQMMWRGEKAEKMVNRRNENKEKEVKNESGREDEFDRNPFVADCP